MREGWEEVERLNIIPPSTRRNVSVPSFSSPLSPTFMLPAALLRAAVRRSGGTVASAVGASSRGLAASAAEAAPAAPAVEMIEVTVNGAPVSVPKGANVMAACTAASVDIPRYGWRGGARRGEGTGGEMLLCVQAPGRVLSIALAPPSLTLRPFLSSIQILLPPAAQHCGQLPHVPGGGERREGMGRKCVNRGRAAAQGRRGAPMTRRECRFLLARGRGSRPPLLSQSPP